MNKLLALLVLLSASAIIEAHTTCNSEKLCSSENEVIQLCHSTDSNTLSISVYTNEAEVYQTEVKYIYYADSYLQGCPIFNKNENNTLYFEDEFYTLPQTEIVGEEALLIRTTYESLKLRKSLEDFKADKSMYIDDSTY